MGVDPQSPAAKNTEILPARVSKPLPVVNWPQAFQNVFMTLFIAIMVVGVVAAISWNGGRELHCP